MASVSYDGQFPSLFCDRTIGLVVMKAAYVYLDKCIPYCFQNL